MRCDVLRVERHTANTAISAWWWVSPFETMFVQTLFGRSCTGAEDSKYLFHGTHGSATPMDGISVHGNIPVAWYSWISHIHGWNILSMDLKYPWVACNIPAFIVFDTRFTTNGSGSCQVPPDSIFHPPQSYLSAHFHSIAYDG